MIDPRLDDYEAQARSGVDGLSPLAPDNALRIAVVDHATGNRSAVWMVWTRKRIEDLFLAERRTRGAFKVSHHEGIWRIAMTSDEAERQGTERAVLDEWSVPESVDGWRQGVAVVIPCAFLAPSDEALSHTVVRAPTSPLHSSIYLRLLFEEAGGTSFVPVDDAFGLGALKLPSGGTVYVAAQAKSLSRDQLEFIATKRAEWMVGTPAEWAAGVMKEDDTDLRLLVDLGEKR